MASIAAVSTDGKTILAEMAALLSKRIPRYDLREYTRFRVPAMAFDLHIGDDHLVLESDVV